MSNDMSRRNFVVRLGNTAVALVLAGSGVVSGKFLWPNLLLEPPTRFRIGALRNLVPGSHLFDTKHRVHVFRDDSGYLYAVSAVCTHLGCVTRFRAEGGTEHPEGFIACPCHGSKFTTKGEVLHGPAQQRLEAYRLTLEDGDLYVDTNQKLDEDEMILRV